MGAVYNLASSKERSRKAVMVNKVRRTILGSSGGFPESLWQEEAYELMNPKQGERGQDGVRVPRKQLRGEPSSVGRLCQ